MSPQLVRLSTLYLGLWGFLGAATNTPDAVKEFNERVAEYVTLHKLAEHGLIPLKPKSTPHQIAAHNQQLTKAIQSSRATAAQGNIFSPAVQTYFLHILKTEMGGKGGKAARATVKDGNPKAPEEKESTKKKVVVQVNALYPEGAPVSTVPPTLLLRLPQLPKEVEYRFVGRDLILRDVAANLIVDFLPNAVPQT